MSKIKVLLVNTRHFRGGGDSTYTFNLAEVLRKKGHDVAFFAMGDERNIPDPNSDLFVSHIDFKELNKQKGLITGAQVLMRVIYSKEARYNFGRLLNRFNPDIVHLQNIHAHITPSIILEARKRNIPVVWTLHDYKLICPNSHFLVDPTGKICSACGRFSNIAPIMKRCKKGSLLASTMAALEAFAHRIMNVRQMVNCYLPPSQFMYQQFIERGFPPSQVRHLPYVLPEGMFYQASDDQGYLLFLGKLEPLKGIYPLLEACKLAPGIELILAGKSEDLSPDELAKLLPSNARYVGLKHGEELKKLLHNARAVVLPSLWYENQPFCIIEAFAAGKPVVASDLGGMTELVNKDERGLLVPPGDVKALAKAMEWVSKNSEQMKEKGKAAHKYALDTHWPDMHYKKLMSIYEEICQTGRYSNNKDDKKSFVK